MLPPLARPYDTVRVQRGNRWAQAPNPTAFAPLTAPLGARAAGCRLPPSASPSLSGLCPRRARRVCALMHLFFSCCLTRLYEAVLHAGLTGSRARSYKRVCPLNQRASACWAERGHRLLRWTWTVGMGCVLCGSMRQSRWLIRRLCR